MVGQPAIGIASGYGDVRVAQFTYTAKDSTGHTVHGDIDAASESQAARELRERGLYPLRISELVEVRPTASRSKEGILAQVFPAVGIKQRYQFWQQLHSVMASGMSISEGLSVLSENTSGRLRQVSRDGAARAACGEQLSEILGSYPGTFPSGEVALVRAAEQSGRIPETIESLVRLTEQELATRRDFSFRLAYPVIVIGFASLVPVIVAAFIGNTHEAARMLMHYHLRFLMIAAGVYVASRFLFALSPPARQVWDAFKFRFPILGSVVRKLASAKASRLVATGYSTGLDMALSVELAASSSGNTFMKNRLMRAIPDIRSGAALSDSLGRTGVLPARAVQMLRTGEQTGNIDTMMNNLSQYYEDEVNSAFRIMAIITGVVALLIAGGVVGYLAVNVFGGYSRQLPV